MLWPDLLSKRWSADIYFFPHSALSMWLTQVVLLWYHRSLPLNWVEPALEGLFHQAKITIIQYAVRYILPVKKINRIRTHIYIFLRAAARDTVGGWEPSNFSPCCWHKNVPKYLRPCSGYLSRRGYCVEDGVMAGARWLTRTPFTHWQQLFCSFVVSVIFWPTEIN